MEQPGQAWYSLAQNLNSCSLCHVRTILQISLKKIRSWVFRNVTNRHEFRIHTHTHLNPSSDLPSLPLTHLGRVTHLCVSKLFIIGSDNGLSPDRHQAIIWTNAGLLLIGPFWTNFSEILIEIPTLSFKKMRLKVSSAKRRPFCLGLNV